MRQEGNVSTVPTSRDVDSGICGKKGRPVGELEV